jgi:hypothetical protein
MDSNNSFIGTPVLTHQNKLIPEIAGNRLVWLHIQRENQKMMLDPLGYDAIKDIDEIHQRNRRKSDDPYIKATSKKMAHHFPKIDDAERR